MTMEELANVKGRGWEDIDVRGCFFRFYLLGRDFADPNHSIERWCYCDLVGEHQGGEGYLNRAFWFVGSNWPPYKHDLRHCRVQAARQRKASRND